MWTFIIIILAIIVIKFFIDLNKQSSEIKKQGGMRNKYSTFANWFEQQGCKLTQETSSSLLYTYVPGPGAYMQFELIQTFGSLSVRYKLQGTHVVKEWEFPENLSQYNMISEIEVFLSAFSR